MNRRDQIIGITVLLLYIGGILMLMHYVHKPLLPGGCCTHNSCVTTSSR